jgi:30S ribosomal protein S31
LRLARKAQQSNQEQTMGKGDRKTAKGKRTNASYGNARKHVVKAAVGVAAPAAKRTITKAAAPANQSVAKKTLANAG